MKAALFILMAGALGMSGAQSDPSKPCEELVTTLYPWLNGRQFPPQEGQIEIRFCPGNIQFLAFPKQDLGQPLLVDTDGLSMKWLILSRNMFLAVLEGASNNIIRVLTFEDGTPLLTYQDGNREELQCELSERVAEFKVGERVMQYRLAGVPEAGLPEEPLPDFSDPKKYGFEALMKHILSRGDKPQAWKAPPLCGEVVTTIYPHWNGWLVPRHYQPHIEIRRCRQEESDASMQLVAWTALAFGPAVTVPVRGTVGTMVMAGNVFLLVTHNGRSQLLYVLRYHRGSAWAHYGGAWALSGVRIKVTRCHVTVTASDGLRGVWVERYPTGE